MTLMPHPAGPLNPDLGALKLPQQPALLFRFHDEQVPMRIDRSLPLLRRAVLVLALYMPLFQLTNVVS